MSVSPPTLYDNANALFYSTGTYNDAVGALSQVWGKSANAVETTLNAKYGAADFLSATQALADEGVVIAQNANGYRCYAYASDTTINLADDLANIINSNATSTSTISAKPVVETAIDSQTGKVSASLLETVTGGQTWQYYAVSGLQALSAVSTGIWLGKTIDSALYNLNPDFWDSHNMSALNPEMWNSITNGDDSFAAKLFNMILGLNPNTGESQLLLDEEALAYIAYYMKEKGVFDAPQGIIENPTYSNAPITTNPPTFGSGASGSVIRFTETYGTIEETASGGDRLLLWARSSARPTYLAASLNNFSLSVTTRWFPDGTPTTRSTNATQVTLNNKTFYYAVGGTNQTPVTMLVASPSVNTISTSPSSDQRKYVAYNMLFDGEIGGTVAGISNQPSTVATQPDVSSWTSPTTTLQSLKQQYPNAFANVVPNHVVQPDGTVETINYVPVPMPTTESQYYDQPTYVYDENVGSQYQPSQTNTIVNPYKTDGTTPSPSDENANLLRTILQLITQPEPNPNTNPETETQPYNEPVNPYNPPVTGTGDTPTPVLPDGSASALWSVYHPTQQQVDDFGGWLWTGNVITQIQQLLQNPMDGIITLHKIFATPVDASNGTIVVGRLDSNVPSATVNQQYVTVDCGSVSLSEQFGNVFDYDPYTSVSLYLPFIGIVPLNVADVMRSTINVTYGVDVFTGACLAMVTVTRDGHDVNMYQYTGVASVEYPLTGAVHSGLINGLLGIAGGVVGVASAATGVGAVAGASAIAGGVASFNRTNNAKSGSFSGNAGAMGLKKPYLIIERPQTKIARTFSILEGYPTNYSIRLGDCSNHVVCKTVHVSGISATEKELSMIESILKSGVEI